LPPGNVPGVEILLAKYGSPLGAHNAFVSTAKNGADYQRVKIEPGNTGICYRTSVWRKDKGTDWACAFSKGKIAVVIRTIVTTGAYSVVQVAQAIARKL